MYKNKNITANINATNINLGSIKAVFYTEDENVASIRITVKNDGKTVDLTRYDMTPKLDVFSSDGSIFLDEELTIINPEIGLIQYNIPSNVIKHVGETVAKLFLVSESKSIHVANFTFDIKDSGIDGAVAKEISVNIIDVAIKKIINEQPELFKGEKGEKGEPFTYEDLTEEQKQDLASYVPVRDIPDSHIIKVIEQDYADTVGQLDVIFVNWKNQDRFYPVVFRKNDYVEIPNQDYETWKQETARLIGDFIIQTDVQNEKELFQKAMERDENSFLGLSLPVFPIYSTVKLPDYSVDDTKYLANNYLSQAGLIESGDRGTFIAKIAYNGRAIEENKVEINFE